MEKTKIYVDKLKELREKRDWSKAELARRIGVSRPYITQMENLSKTPSMEVALSIAQVFGCNVWDLTSDNVKESDLYKKAMNNDRYDELANWMRDEASDEQQTAVFSVAEDLGFPATKKNEQILEIPNEFRRAIMQRCLDLGISVEEYAYRLLTAKNPADLSQPTPLSVNQ